MVTLEVARDDRRAVMKAVVFYESAADMAEKAPLHAAAHRARWGSSPAAATC